MANNTTATILDTSTPFYTENQTQFTEIFTTNFSADPTEGLNDTKCAIFHGDEYKCDVIVHIRRAFSSISLVGCLFVIGIIWLFRKYVIFSQRLILYLSISAILYCIFFIMGNVYDEGPFCTFQAWGVTVFNWSVLLWVCCITLNLHMNAVWMRTTERFEWAYHAVSWGVPILVSFIPFINDHYGPAGSWCWIKNDWAWRFGIWYCPLIIILIILILTYSCTFAVINRRVKTWEGLYDPDVERKKEVLKEDVKPLKAYPFVYLACSIFPLINRIQNSVNPDNPVFGLMVLHALSSPLPGALNAVVFALDKDTTSKLTWTQLKLAFQARRVRSPGLIQEYPAENNAMSDYQSTTIQSQSSSIMA